MVDTVQGVGELVDKITKADPVPFIFIDIEGANLSRRGSVSLMQLLVPPEPIVHLLDVLTLQAQAFHSVGETGKSLKDVFEADEYVKVFFDVRNDSDALFSHFGINLKGIVDLQLVEYASRSARGSVIKGLARCIAQDAPLTWSERQAWTRTKDAGLKLFAPEKGGKYAVFNHRPLSVTMHNYCVQDVLLLPTLLSTYVSKLPPHRAIQVYEESQRRVSQSQRADFYGKGRHMTLAPAMDWDP
jgi:exonuclease 3'-5' domain-containing protein 1